MAQGRLGLLLIYIPPLTYIKSSSEEKLVRCFLNDIIFFNPVSFFPDEAVEIIRNELKLNLEQRL